MAVKTIVSMFKLNNL